MVSIGPQYIEKALLLSIRKMPTPQGLAAVERLLAQHPGHPDLLLEKVRCLCKKNQPDSLNEAELICKELQRHQNSRIKTEAQALLAKIFWQRDQPQVGAKLTKGIIEPGGLRPYNIYYTFLHIRMLLDAEKDPAACAALIVAALKNVDFNPDAWEECKTWLQTLDIQPVQLKELDIQLKYYSDIEPDQFAVSFSSQIAQLITDRDTDPQPTNIIMHAYYIAYNRRGNINSKAIHRVAGRLRPFTAEQIAASLSTEKIHKLIAFLSTPNRSLVGRQKAKRDMINPEIEKLRTALGLCR